MKEAQVLDLERQKFRRRYGMFASAIWLVFLGFPIYFATIFYGGTWKQPVIYLSCVVTAVGYLYFFSYFSIFVHRSAGAHARIKENITLGVTVLAIVTPTLITGELAFAGNLLYAMAMFTYSNPLSRAYWFLGMVFFAITGISLWQQEWSGLLTLTWLCAISVGMIFGRRETDYEGRRIDAVARTRVAEERDRVARDVHDVLGHSLTLIVLKAQLVEKLIERNPDQARLEAQAITTIARNGLTQVRSTVTDLRAADLEEQLQTITETLSMTPLRLQVVGDPEEMKEEYRSDAAWMIRETVTNAIKHARHATAVRITLQPASVTVEDDGSGIPPSVTFASLSKTEAEDKFDEDSLVNLPRGGNGLAGLRRRIERFGGTLTVQQAQLGGLALCANWPHT